MEHHHFKSQFHHKIKPLRYGPYTTLQQIGPNSYHLDFTPQLGMYDVVNGNSLKFYESPLIGESVTISHPTDFINDFHPPLLQDTLLETHIISTRQHQHTSYLFSR